VDNSAQVYYVTAVASIAVLLSTENESQHRVPSSTIIGLHWTVTLAHYPFRKPFNRQNFADSSINYRIVQTWFSIPLAIAGVSVFRVM